MQGAGSVTHPTDGSSTMDFEQYVVDAHHRLYRFAVVLCGDPVLAGDLLGNVLARAFERWPRVGATRDPHAYVRRMLVNEYVTWQRQRARTIPHPEVDRIADRLPNAAADPGERHADRAALLEELSRLPARQRAAIVLRYYADLSDADIAATLGCRIGTVRSSISRGLATLRVIRTSSDDDRTRS